MNLRTILCLATLSAFAVVSGKWMSATTESAPAAQSSNEKSVKRIIGPVAKVGARETEIHFLARVDTGAETCSLHTVEKIIQDASKFMEENLGKIVRFRVENRQGESHWMERPIADVREICTSEGEEVRYLVPMNLICHGVEREVLVSLNDRSRMTYSMLLGRNFLAGEFVVDVTEPEQTADLLASGL